MKILYVIHSLPIGGAEVLVVNYIIALKKANIDVSVLEINHTDSFLSNILSENKIPYYTLFPNNRFERLLRFDRYRISREMNRFINSFKPDIIHYHTIFRHIDRIDFPAKRIVFTFHSRVERLFKLFPYIKSQLKNLNNNGMQFIAISKPVTSDIIKHFDSPNIWNIPNGIDLDSIRGEKREKSYLYNLLSIPNDSFIVGQVGRFNRIKNHVFTLQLFKDILKQNPKTHLVFVGTGNDKEIGGIHQIIEDLGIAANIHLMGLREDATSIMSCFDTLVLPSLSESFSLVLVEAQANNVRCVVSDVVPEDVICNSNCIVLPLDSPKNNWVEAILGNSVRKEVKSLEQFDIKAVVQQHIKLYKAIVKND